MLHSLLMFAAHLNCCSHIKYHLVFFVFILLVSDSTIYKRLNLSKLLLFYKAIKQQSCVVLAVIRPSTTEVIVFVGWLLS